MNVCGKLNKNFTFFFFKPSNEFLHSRRRQIRIGFVLFFFILQRGWKSSYNCTFLIQNKYCDNFMVVYLLYLLQIKSSINLHAKN